MPKSRVEFWTEKLNGNVERDARQVAALEAAGWTVMTLWECQTRDADALKRFVNNVRGRVPAARRPPGDGLGRIDVVLSA